MAKSDSTYHGLQVPASTADAIGFDDDFKAMKTYIDGLGQSLGAYQQGKANSIGTTSAATNAGKFISSISSNKGRVIALATGDDATLTFQDHGTDPTTGTDKYTLGYHDDGDGFALNVGATLHGTLASNDFSMDSGGDATFANDLTVGTDLSVTGTASFPGGVGAIDAGVNDITTGGQFIIDVNGTDAGAAGSLTVGAGGEAALYFDGSDLFLETDSGDVIYDAAGGEHVFNDSGSLIGMFTSSVFSGLSLAAGYSYRIDFNSVLNATTLGSGVVNSSLTSVGTLGGLTMGGDIVMADNSVTGIDTLTFTDVNGTIAGIENQNLLDKAATESVSGTWTFTGTSVDIENYIAVGDGSSPQTARTVLIDRDFSAAQPQQLYITGAVTQSSTSSFALVEIEPVSTTLGAAGIIPIVSSLAVTGPGILETVGTVTNVASVYVTSLETLGDNNYAIWVDSGAVKFDSTLDVDGATALNAALTMGANIVMADNSVTGVDTLTFTDVNGTIAGVENQNLLDKSATETVSGDYTFTGVLTIPQSATPTVNADGEIAVGTTVTDFSMSVIKFYGGEEQGIVAMPIAQFTTPTDGYVVSYNATNAEFELVDAVAVGGDVTAAANITDHALVRGDGGGKGIQDSGIIVTDTDGVSGIDTLSVTDNITSYKAENDGNPQFFLGATSAERFEMQAVFDSGAQTLDYVQFDTAAASATANKGAYHIAVDGTDILDINDDGIDLVAGNEYYIGGASKLSATTLGAAVVSSSLTTVGALNSGSITTGFGSIDIGVSNFQTGGQYLLDVDGSAPNAAGSITFGAGTDAGIWFDGTNLNIMTDGAGASGIILDSEDDTVEIKGSGVLQTTFDSNGIDLNSGLYFAINTTSVLTSTTLGSGVVNSSLTSVGTIATGVWEGTTVAVDQGGTGQTSYTNGQLLIGNTTGNTLTKATLSAGAGIAITNGTGTITVATDGVLEDLDTLGPNAADSEFLVGTGSGALAWEDAATAAISMGVGTSSAAQFLTLGVGIARTEGTAHIHTASAGAVTAQSTADDLVVENSADGGISILVPDLSAGRIYFGTPSDQTGGFAEWEFTGTTFTMGTAAAGGITALVSGNDTVALTLDSSQDATFGGSVDIPASESYSVNGTAILSDAAGTMTLRKVDALDITTEMTIEAAIDKLANLTSATALVSVGTITTGTWSATDVAVAAGGTGASDAATARTNLGIAIGSDVQAFSAALTDLDDVGIVPGDSYFLVGTGSGTLAWETTTTVRTSIGLGTGDAAQFTTLGVGIARTEGTAHIRTATAGSVSPSASADDLVVENSGNGGIHILTPDASNASVYFGSPSDPIGARITWNHDEATPAANTGVLTIGTSNSGATVKLYGGYLTAGIDVSNTGMVTVGMGESGATVNTAADDFVVEHSTAGGMSILVPDASISRFYMGTPTDPTGFQLLWDYPNTRMQMGTATASGEFQLLSGNGSLALTLDSSQDATFAGNVYVGTPSSYSDEFVITGTTSAAMAIENTGSGAVSLFLDSDRSGVGQNIGQVVFRWNNYNVAAIFAASGLDTTNKDEGSLHFQTAPPGGTARTRMIIDTEGGVHLQRRPTADDPTVIAQYGSIYGKDVAASAEIFVQDETSNVTQLSPHDKEGFWWFNSYSSKRDITIRAHIERAFRWLIDEKGMPSEYLEEYSGNYTSE